MSETESIKTTILKFSWPVFVSMIFSELYNITNSLIVGNYVSLKALSAVSACTWICNIFNYSFYGLGMGAGILVARCYGARDHEQLKKILDTSLVFALFGGIALTIVSELGLPVLLRLCHVSADIYEDAYRYLQVYLLGNSAVLTSQMCFFIMRSFGDTRHQLYYAIISSLVNIVLGMVLVRGLHLDVTGTAIATIISQFVMDVLALRLLASLEEVDLDLFHPFFSWHVVKDICALGIPASFQNMLIAFSSMLVQSYVNRFPNEVIAGIGVAEKISGWAQLASVSISSATIALVGRYLGAKDYEKVKETIRECVILSGISTSLLIIIIFALAPQLVAAFNDSGLVIRYGTEMIRCSIFSMFFISLSHIYNAACRGAGNVRVPMRIAIAGQVIAKYLFVALGLKLYHDVHILYLGTAFGFTLSGLLATLYFKTSSWTQENNLR